MTNNESALLDRILSYFDEAQRAGMIVYLEREPHPAGTLLTLGNLELSLPWDARLAFVDLEPSANWAHACAYVLLGAEDDLTRVLEARFPPETDSGFYFMLLWKGPNAPDWAVLTWN